MGVNFVDTNASKCKIEELFQKADGCCTKLNGAAGTVFWLIIMKAKDCKKPSVKIGLEHVLYAVSFFRSTTWNGGATGKMKNLFDRT